MVGFFESEFFAWAVLPFLIVMARMLDVTLGTLRIIFVSRGNRLIAPILGFFEVLIWIVVIGQIMKNLNNPLTYFAYAFGFAIGNYLGIEAEEKLAIGFLVIRLFVISGEEDLRAKIIDAGFGVTSIEGRGSTGKVTILFSVIKRKDLDRYLSIVNESSQEIFYSVETATAAHLGIYPSQKKKKHLISPNDILRKITGGIRKRK
ncbi:MAG: DUF2179 domain-containing protein [Hungateiclostridium thermocellum]|nr:DUF2179 domain-containing protein [Acetivibrio thermocellus]